MRGALDKVLSSGKYLMVAVSLVVLFFLNNPRWAIPIRVGDFFNSVKLTFEHADNFWIARTLFIAIRISSGHPHSRFLVPLSLSHRRSFRSFNKFSLFKYFKTKDCDDCDKCREVCDLETRPLEANCTNCGACDTICPVDAIKVGWKEADKTAQ